MAPGNSYSSIRRKERRERKGFGRTQEGKMNSSNPPQVPPAIVLHEMLGGYGTARLISVAAKLGLADHLAGGIQTPMNWRKSSRPTRMLSTVFCMRSPPWEWLRKLNCSILPSLLLVLAYKPKLQTPCTPWSAGPKKLNGKCGAISNTV